RAIERDYQRLDKLDAEQRGIPIPAGKSTVEVANKAHILEKRVFYKEPEPKAETAADAAGISLNTYGRLNLPAMSKLLGKTEQQIITELGDKAFNDPREGYVTSDEYLSGNVKAKLAEAKAMAEKDPAFQRNVLALEDVQPADIAPGDIHVALGSPWVPGEHYGTFAREVLGIGDARVSLNRVIQKFDLGGVQGGTERFGTSRFSARKVYERVLNHSDATVYDYHEDGKRTVNPEATEAMRGAMDVMQDEFRDWVWKDQNRRNVLHRLYNDTHNTDRARTYDGSHLTFPGKVDDSIIALRPHQINGAWRAIQDGRMLADHVVGAGKTFMYIAAAMKMKQMGLAKKPMLAVPNHLVQQWAGDWMKLYPNANILAVTENDFTADRRKLTFSRIATGDWDAVIVAHSQFSRISPPAEFEQQYLAQKKAELLEAKTNVEGGDRRSIKQIEKMIESLGERVKAINDRLKRDRDTVGFDEMGIDNLIVDEAHEFKNLGFTTNKTRVSGLGTAANGGSQKAEDLFIKAQYLQSLNKGRGLFFATGTPVSNTLAEMFTMQRYMANAEMRGRGIHLFDLWANTFAHETTSFELDSSGRGLKAKTVLSKFLNVPEMMQLYKRFADTITLNDLKEITKAAGGEWPVPKIKGGRAQNTVVKPSEALLSYIENNIIPRMEAVSGQNGQKPDPRVDNMLKITNDARLAALDVRLRDPLAPDDPNSKPNQMISDAMELYKKWQADRGAQLIFCDLSTPATAVSKEKAAFDELVRRAAEGDEAAAAKLDAMSPDDQLALSAKFSVYDDVKKKLIAAGVPEREIAFIHDANTDLQKKALFDKVNRGDVRFLMGSTAKMGAGTNVQERLVALHHLDAPWRPSDLEQREGRIVRQGNSLYARDPDGFEVEINRYATERTYDSRMWQLIERKAGIVEQIRKGDNTLREVDDVAGEAANAAEMKAAATGNPLIIEQVELQAKVKRLETQQRAYNNRRWDAENEVTRLNADGGPEGRYERAKERADAADKTLEANPRDPFSVTVGSKTYDEFKAGANAFATSVVKAIGDMERSGGHKTYPVGTYRGADVTLARQYGGIDVLRVAYPNNPVLGDIGFAMDMVDKETGAVSGAGLLTKVNNVINRIGQWGDDAQRQLARDKRRLGELNDLLATPFRGGDELKEAQARLKVVTDTLVKDSAPKGQPAPEMTGPPASAKPFVADFDLGDTKAPAGYKPPNLNDPKTKAIYSMVEKIAAPLRRTGVDIRVVDDHRGFPASVRANPKAQFARGVFLPDPKTGRTTLFLNASKLATVAQAKRTLMHELVGHYGMEKLLGEQFDSVAKDALRLVRTDPRLAAIKERVARYKDFGERK
ncbi:MAG TPA: DEAD/DEAH box helicase family protein, partial [Rhodanobacteraceae bacterium]|nr:DEAD/DEAH box helicase family protein [Rhodanobacteraceae bacterium]